MACGKAKGDFVPFFPNRYSTHGGVNVAGLSYQSLGPTRSFFFVFGVALLRQNFNRTYRSEQRATGRPAGCLQLGAQSMLAGEVEVNLCILFVTVVVKGE